MTHFPAPHELEPLTPVLQEFSLAQIDGLIDESARAFSPSRTSPDTDTRTLLAEMQSDPAFRIFGYTLDGKPVSYIVALSYKSPDAVAIGPMFVSAAARGQGLGKRQVQDFVASAAADGYTSVFTKTWGNNQASQRIFGEMGFTIQSVKPDDRADGDSTISYWLDIA